MYPVVASSMISPIMGTPEKPEVVERKVYNFIKIIVVLELIFLILHITGYICLINIEYTDTFFKPSDLLCGFLFFFVFIPATASFVLTILTLTKKYESYTAPLILRFILFPLTAAITGFTSGSFAERTSEGESYHTTQMLCFGINIGLNILIVVFYLIINGKYRRIQFQQTMDQICGQQPYSAGVLVPGVVVGGVGVVPQQQIAYNVNVQPLYVVPGQPGFVAPTTQQNYGVPQQQNNVVPPQAAGATYPQNYAVPPQNNLAPVPSPVDATAGAPPSFAKPS